MTSLTDVLFQPDWLAEGWMKWYGGDCPVRGDRMVRFKFADGYTTGPMPAEEMGWHNQEWPHDASFWIVAYRVEREAP